MGGGAMFGCRGWKMAVLLGLWKWEFGCVKCCRVYDLDPTGRQVQDGVYIEVVMLKGSHFVVEIQMLGPVVYQVLRTM